MKKSILSTSAFICFSLALGAAACGESPDGSDNDEGTGGQASGGAGDPGAGGAPASGGSLASGGSGAGGSGSGAGPSGSGGQSGPGGQGGQGGEGGHGGNADEICDLAWQDGDCDAYIQAFWHNPETGACEPQIYGGCGGNENRFPTSEECEEACGAPPSGASCKVDGQVYPDGADQIPDPTSCNTCICNDGQLNCTEINCPSPCEAGTALGTSCISCGPTDACLIVETGCLSTCDSTVDADGQCDEGNGFCLDNLCRAVCG
jgi:hypothetical protein